MAVGINEGTQTFLTSTTNGTEQIVHNQVSGGTLGVVSNLTNGTIRVSVGTVVGGTLGNINFGTFDTFYRHPDEFATVISSGTSTLGTIKAAISGSAIYVTDIVVSAGTATNLEVASGGTSTPILGTLHFSTNGGAVMNFRTPIRTASGSALVYKQSTNGALTLTVTGYVD